jgi:hypothetical protein
VARPALYSGGILLEVGRKLETCCGADVSDGKIAQFRLTRFLTRFLDPFSDPFSQFAKAVTAAQEAFKKTYGQTAYDQVVKQIPEQKEQ